MKTVPKIITTLLLCCLVSTVHADVNEDRAEGIAWLLQNQNGDGSWGRDKNRVAATAEALAALRNAGSDKNENDDTH